MTRQKKSRKPGTLGAKSTPKNLRQRPAGEGATTQSKRKGKPPGNRHSIETQAKTDNQASNQPTGDPRVGSKRKIPLAAPSVKAGPEQRPEEHKNEQPTSVEAAPNPASVGNPSAPVDDSIKFAEDEFARLENDPRLQDLLAQLDAGDTVAPEDQAWVDQQLDRYQQLADQLGVNLDDENADEDDDELEPWQKFENPKDWV